MGLFDDPVGYLNGGLSGPAGKDLTSYLGSLLAPPEVNSYYDPNRSFAQNALDPRGIEQAMNVGLSFGPGATKKLERIDALTADRLAAERGERAAGSPVSSFSAIQAAEQPQGIKAYHGSPDDFRAFDMGKAGSTTDSGALGKAAYFSTDPKVAEPAPHRYEVQLNASNPLPLQMDAWPVPGRGVEAKRKLITDALGIPGDSAADQITAAATRRGYDSASLDYSPLGYKHQEYAVFDPSIIEVLRKYGLGGLTAGAGATGGLYGSDTQY